jgi:nitrogen fixation protein NifU and related proteins
MASPYSEKVMEHFKNPKNVGEMKDPDGIGKMGNPSCGDIMEMYIRVKDNVITDAKFKTFGCAAAIATSSMITEMVIGKTIKEALEITNKMVVEALDGLPPVKVHCSVLGEDALKGAIDDYLKKTTGKGLPGWKPRNEEVEHEH